ncbi:MAG: hypothetical protein MI674_01275, partial [Cytophagales bacterium]|nr:hypothetical protein [Cytophagales bacterium]
MTYRLLAEGLLSFIEEYPAIAWIAHVPVNLQIKFLKLNLHQVSSFVVAKGFDTVQYHCTLDRQTGENDLDKIFFT